MASPDQGRDGKRKNLGYNSLDEKEAARIETTTSKPPWGVEEKELLNG